MYIYTHIFLPYIPSYVQQEELHNIQSLSHHQFQSLVFFFPSLQEEADKIHAVLGCSECSPSIEIQYMFYELKYCISIIIILVYSNFIINCDRGCKNLANNNNFVKCFIYTLITQPFCTSRQLNSVPRENNYCTT